MIDAEADYLFAEAFWRVSDFKGLNEWLKLIADDLPEFHGVVCSHSTGWRVLRSKYGINPIDAENDDEVVPHRPKLTAAEMARYLKMKADDISPLLTSIAAMWNDYLTNRPDRPKVEKKPEKPQDESAVAESLESLLGYGFARSIFDLPGRDSFERKSEVLWMAERVTELNKMFEEPMAKTLARQAILNEMFMRRCDDQMTKTHPKQKEFWAIQDTKLKIEAMYQKQWAQLETICPFIKAAVGKITVSGLMSEFVESVKAARHTRKLDLVDGLYDAFGIQVDLRTSPQDPTPRYRPSIVAMVNEARKGIWDPSWVCPISARDFKLMDTIFRTGYERMVEDGRIKQTDIEEEGPEGEYPQPTEDGLESLPAETVKLNDRIPETIQADQPQHPSPVDPQAPPNK